jgi:hypothetical protein
LINGSSPLCNVVGYTIQSVDISAYADDGVHQLEFHSETNSSNLNVSNFFVDVISMPGVVSMCTQDTVTSLTLIKHLPNDDGGSATQDQFQAYVDGTPVSWDTPIVLTAGAHTASEDTLPGYQALGWSNACASNGAVTLNPGDELTCEITNDDIASDSVIFADGYETK